MLKKLKVMKKLIFCILTVPNIGLLYVISPENSEKRNVELAMEKDSKVLERFTVETNKECRSFMKEMLSITENVLFGFDGGVYGELVNEGQKIAFKTLIEKEQSKAHQPA